MKNRQLIEIIGILSVVGSLIFVGIEISQNTTAVRGATQQAVSAQVTEMYTITAHLNCVCNSLIIPYHPRVRKHTDLN